MFHTSQYAWNSATIDNITRSIATVGREFRYPLDVDLSPTPNLNNSYNSALFQYLRNIGSNAVFVFATSVLKILIEEPRTTHQEHHSKSKHPCALKVGDVVKAHIQVQYFVGKGVVIKLSYRAKGPFVIIAALGRNSYEVQRYGKPKSATHKYKNTELCLLPPALFPLNPLDTVNQRYLSSTHTPICNPLMKSLQIELYNNTWL